MKIPAATALFLLSASASWAQDEHIGVRLREWYATLEGQVTADTDSQGGTRIDLADDLGLDDPKFSAEIQVYGRIPLFGKIYAGWWRVSRSGDETLTRTIDFAGETFTGSTQVKSEVTLDVGYLTYEFLLPSIPLGDVIQWEIGLQLGVRVFRGEGSIESDVVTGSDSGVFGTPILGGHMALQVTPYLRTDVELLGMAFSYSSHRGSYLEAYGEIVFQPFSWLFAGVGYKYVSLEMRETGSDSVLDMDIHISGFYLTAGVRF